MHRNKRARLEAHGWRVGGAADFLALTPEEAALVETKLALSGSVRERRMAQGLSQADLANRLKSSQSRIAKFEAADPTVPVDLLLRALFAPGRHAGRRRFGHLEETESGSLTAVSKMSPRPGENPEDWW